MLGGIAGVRAIMPLASVALAAYPQQQVGRGNTTTCLMNVRETVHFDVVSSYVD